LGHRLTFLVDVDRRVRRWRVRSVEKIDRGLISSGRRLEQRGGCGIVAGVAGGLSGLQQAASDGPERIDDSLLGGQGALMGFDLFGECHDSSRRTRSLRVHTFCRTRPTFAGDKPMG
jgi:hypothetical protein